MNLNLILIITGAALIVAGSLMDLTLSSGGRMFGATEQTRFFRDRDGFFNAGKYAAVIAVVLALYLIGMSAANYLQPHPAVGAFAVVFGLIGGGFRAHIALRNRSRREAKRKKQIEILRNPDGYLIQVRQATDSKIWFGELFSFFSSHAGTYEEAQKEIREKIFELSKIPAADWFDERMISAINDIPDIIENLKESSDGIL